MPHIMGNFNITSRCASAYRDEALAEFGLTDAQYPYVLRVVRSPGITQDELSHQLCIHKSNVTRHLAALEESGYVERRRCEEDRRVTLVFPTKKAYAILPRLREVTREWNEYLTEGLDEAELERFAELLSKMADRAREYVKTREEASE